jgi:sensor histidine kinase YesM
MIYVLFISVLFLSAKLRVEKNVMSDSIAVQKQAEAFFDKIYADTEKYNQMQSIRNVLVYSIQNPDLDLKATQEFSKFSSLPENITIYNLEKQIYPNFNFMKPLPAHVSNNEQMQAIVHAKSDNFFYLYVPYYNFTKTVILGYLCVEIPSTKLYEYIGQGFQNDLRFKLLDIDHDKIFANVVSDKLMLSKHSTSERYGITCVVYGDLYSEYSSAKLFSIVLIPICLIVLLISYFYASKTAKKFSSPINMLIEFIETNKNGQFTYTYKEPVSFDEINTLFAKYYEMIDEINDLIDKNQKSNLLKTEAELRLLQEKINPHFLFNALELISGQAILENAGKTSELIQNLGYLFRYDLRLPDVVSLKEEIKQSRNYMNMQNTLFNNTLKLEYHIDQNLMDIAIPKCTFQPILENCFKHAFTEITNKNIQIKVFINSDDLKIVFEDNGKGVDEKTLKNINQSLIRDYENFAYFIDRREHIGLRNVNARLCLHFKLTNALQIENNLSGGTKVTISVPMSNCMKKD